MKYIWLDVDPGHDDATAILLALHCGNVDVLGISTTHGNTSSKWSALNAARCLEAFGADPSLKIYPGAQKPLLRTVKHDPQIHGIDGLGGVEGLPEHDSPGVNERFAVHDDGTIIPAIEGITNAIKSIWNQGKGHQVTIISTGPMTNIALFVAAYPNLLEAVEELVFMGGGVGLGNRSAVAEFNILCDPHAAQIVLDTPVKKTMIPINLTHTAIVTRQMHARLLKPDFNGGSTEALPVPSSPLRHTLSTLIGYFAAAYKSTFGFNDGPPLHDALTLAYVSRPDLFQSKRYRVDVELTGTHSVGETVVDVWNYRPCDQTWGSTGKNCIVAQTLDVNGFFEMFFECVERCDKVSPLNSMKLNN